MSHFRASLSLLPPELIEEIIIISTLLGDVRAPSTLAQTCRTFRTLIYHQAHKHLWREMFLIHFDDPRPAHEVRAHGRVPQRLQLNPNDKGKGKSKNYLASHDFSWEDEYKMRIWTESFILRRTRPPLSESSSPRDARPDQPSTDAELYTILETLLRVILTAAPLPYHTLARMASHSSPSSPPHPHPIFSPVLIVAHTHPTLGHGSRNISWLARVLAHGLPRALMARLTVFDENGKVDAQKRPVRWDGLLAKLVAQVGLMTPYNGTPRILRATGLGESDDESESDVNSDEVFHPTVMSATASQDGPPGAVEEDEQTLIDHNSMRLGSPPTAVPSVPPIPDTDTNTDTFLSTVAGAIRSDLDLEGIDFSQFLDDNDDDDDDGADDDNDDETVGVAMADAQSSDILGDQPLHFDWAWIAAARQVIELNLRDLLRRDRHQGVLRALLSLEGLRSCCAPGFPPSAPEPAVYLGEDENGRTFKDGDGWDWAGVEGQWRRCACWMDYRDLIGNNVKPLAARFINPALNEVMRIIPFTLSITHYSRGPASWPGRPKIHVAGYAAQDRLKSLRGTVEMTASGDVRWTISSFREDGQAQWSTQGVQIGARGSAMGVIGLWTSAEHGELSDPLGNSGRLQQGPQLDWRNCQY
ncbi:hypothetical protein F5888DRAFT_1638533 [Russula emetica]|nr:hypothetical protein F5888DRAFT_1638533 [Russula emetica]